MALFSPDFGLKSGGGLLIVVCPFFGFSMFMEKTITKMFSTDD
jgi:hypothetical protein